MQQSRPGARSRNEWLSERRRSALSGCIAAGTAALLLGIDRSWARYSGADVCVLLLLAYLFPYLLITTIAFSTAPPERVRTWAGRETRGTMLQRYVYGTAPGPGVSLFIAAAALVVAVVWRPGHIGSAFEPVPRALAALALVAVAWICVAVSFAVAFQADNLVEGERALEFPGDGNLIWIDYIYFAFSVMTTFGTTDVTVMSKEMRRTVTANACIAFVFNTITVASLVSALDSV
ncbi:MULTISPECIES: DUF1345 domain-containing protein [unclassified Streptomyces]|uniref:DUF1345 domain-containing protein n=1 Tax=unclassified Streptomyces TaxID=2593676 RepID=UPI001E64A6D0|nr:DUF1345 domain-containing protein [Streptomyces sp. CB02980]MCB8901483.1 DUF1345 domain-containing protein [Streptomyces sp. CB02980]